MITKYAEKLAVSMRNSAVQDVVYAVDEAYWRVVSLKEKKRLARSFVGLVDSLRFNVGAMLKVRRGHKERLASGRGEIQRGVYGVD